VTPKLPGGSASVAAFALADVDLDGDDDLLLASRKGTLTLEPRGAGWIAGLPGCETPPVPALEPTEAPVVDSILLAAPLGEGPAVSWIAGIGNRVRVLDPSETRNRGLGVRLTGRLEPGQTRANTGGVGARVEVTARGATRVREMRTNARRAGRLARPARLRHGSVGQADYVPDHVAGRRPPERRSGPR
jgi:hypothetical protein